MLLETARGRVRFVNGIISVCDHTVHPPANTQPIRPTHAGYRDYSEGGQ